MKKLLKPTRKKGSKSAGQKEEIIDLENMVPEQPSDGEDVLDLTNEISPDERESLEAGVIELTEQLPSSSTSVNQEKDIVKGASDNVIHLSDMASGLMSDESEDLEEITQQAILGFSDEDSDSVDDKDLTRLTQQLESAMATSYEDEDDSIEKLPDANIIEIDDFDEDGGEESDQFDFLPEAEPGMADNIDSMDMGELDDDTTFADIENELKYGGSDPIDLHDEVSTNKNDSIDEDVSVAALELNRAMEADREGAYENGEDEDLSEEIQSIRNKLDNVFPEDDSQDPLTVFDTSNQFDDIDDDVDFNTDELVLPPFDENEAGAMAASFNSNSFETKAAPLDLGTDLESDAKSNSLKKSRAGSKTDPFDGNINLYNTRTSSRENKIDLFGAEASISNSELDSAVQRLIESRFGDKIERMIVQAIEKAVAREIIKIKKAILDESDSLD